ncbi:MAG: LamG domain-containing protein [Kiritimatiellales bacterium]|nr:LamG domain-containing protein [Kiritimatiellales bacterium]
MIGILCVALPLSGHGQINRNHALVLDGVDDFVTVPDTVPLRLSTNNFSFCAWIYLESYAQYNSPIVFKRTGTPTDVEGYVLSVGGTAWPWVSKKFYYQVKGGLNPAVVSTSDIPLHRWTHVAMVHDVEAQVAVIYINGKYDAEVPNILTPGLANTVDLHIGNDSMTDPTPGYEYYFHGMLDEIQFWSRKLTPEEINAFKRRPLSGDEEGLIGYWRFKHGTTEDLSGNEYDGIPGPDTETIIESTPHVTIAPAVSIVANNCMPTTVLELQYTTDLIEGSWVPITREYRTLTDGGRIYSDPVIDATRLYRLFEVGED